MGTFLKMFQHQIEADPQLIKLRNFNTSMSKDKTV